MPKMKTNAAAKKRFSFTGTGKIKRKHAYHSHILTKKSTKQKRNLCYSGTVSAADEAKIKNLLVKFAILLIKGQISPEERERITSLTVRQKLIYYATFSQRCCVTRKEKKSFETCQG